MNKFQKLGLSKPLVEILSHMGLTSPTPIQEQSIPILLTKNPTDFIGLAQTGTGKTAAYGLPIVELIDVNNTSVQALVMTPTRELGQQIAGQLQKFSKINPNLNVEAVYGGTSIVNQINALKKQVQIVVATPGRLLDMINRKAVKLGEVKYVILDEADEMLNMGFQEPINKILSYTKQQKAIWLFSATMPSGIRRIVEQYMSKPEEVIINSGEKINKDISHKYVMTKVKNKIPTLRRFMDKQPEMRGIMFCRTKREVQEIANEFNTMRYRVEVLHGDLSQSQRDAVMKRFRTSSMQLLIATDIAARGIDINDITHVIHHTLPDQSENYTHRSGRTGRAGNKGISIAFINPRELRKIKNLEQRINVKFEHIEVPTIDEVQHCRVDNWVQQLLDKKIREDVDQFYERIKSRFEGVGKDQILKKLISDHLEVMTLSYGEEANLNENEGESLGKREHKKFKKYSINLGSVDGFIKKDIIHLLSDLSRVDQKFFENVKMLKNKSHFEIDRRYDRGLSKKFEGVELEGRSVRVDLDNDESRNDGKMGGYYKNKIKFKRSKERGKSMKPSRTRR